jgi:hypothetical protein
MVRPLILFLVTGSALAADPVLPHYARAKSLGVASCASSLCHGSVEAWKSSRVQQNEYVIWSRSDPHGRSHATLSSERAADIVRRLGLKQPATEAAACLDCHVHNVPPERRMRGFALSDGISCEACHGPAERWLASHTQPGAKRPANHARGMYPISDNMARARLCLSCHLGNAQKLVTHRMMAAGHPRMSFEMDTFSQILPPHYPPRSDGVRMWALGQALAAEELLALLTDAKRGRDGLFPELVLFDCHACHHPMSDKRYAGARTGVSPGAVRLNDSYLLMVRHIARRVDAAAGEALARESPRLHAALAGGDDALARARAVQATIQELLPKIAAYRFSTEDLRAVLLALIDDGLAGHYSDYQGAEQAAMAVQALADLMSRRGLLRSADIKPAISRLMAAVDNDEKYAAAGFVRALRELRGDIENSR